MTRRNTWGLAAACLVVIQMAGPAAADEEDADKLSKEIHGQLYRAIKAKDVDGMMKLVDVPWFGLDKTVIKDGQVAKAVVKDKKDLKRRFKEFLDSIGDTSELNPEIKEVWSCSQYRDELKNKPDALKLLDELKMTGKDRVIRDNTLGYFLVRIRDRKAKIVGIIGN